jgi:citrate lyase beta subunit
MKLRTTKAATGAGAGTVSLERRLIDYATIRQAEVWVKKTLWMGGLVV